MAELIDYVRTLSDEIGPRPATTDAEHRAAEWLATKFGSHGLETEIQEFDAPRTYAWAYVIYHLLTLASAVVAGPAIWGGRLVWVAVAASAISAFFLWSDLDTRWGFTKLMPKGPSQNVIARHVPRARRGERLRRIVLVAHYDSARASLAFSPGTVGGFPTTFALMKWSTFATPVFVLLMALPFTSRLEPWLWYATIAVSAYLVVPLVINIHRELFMPFVAGANDNASGVAAMIGIMERLVPAPDATTLATGGFPSLRRGPAAAEAADVVPEGAELSYSQQGADSTALPDDFEWAEPQPEGPRSQGVLDFDTIEFAAVDPAPHRREVARRPVEDWAEGEPAPAAGTLPPEVASSGPDDLDEGERSSRRGGLFGGAKRKERTSERSEMRDWLGVDENFDARKEGGKIGSWDNFGKTGDDDSDDDPDGFGWKGGWAGDDPIGDPEFAASEAARIRRRITEDVDRELTEKEIWFVATGAEEVGTVGMEALLRDYGEDLRDALIINIDNVGSGQLHWLSAEGMARKYRAAQRLVGLARRVSRETETVIKPRVFKGLSTDASPALARGYRAVTIIGLSSDGVPVNWHWKTDTSENIDTAQLDSVVEFVTAMIRDA